MKLDLDATKDPGISLLRTRVPEFEPAFQDAVEAEFGEIGPFAAMSAFSRWVRERLDRDDVPESVVKRAFDAVDALIVDRDIQLGLDLGSEFVEDFSLDTRAKPLMGPHSRALLDKYPPPEPAGVWWRRRKRK